MRSTYYHRHLCTVDNFIIIVILCFINMIKIVDKQAFTSDMLMTCDLVMGYSNIQQKIACDDGI